MIKINQEDQQKILELIDRRLEILKQIESLSTELSSLRKTLKDKNKQLTAIDQILMEKRAKTK